MDGGASKCLGYLLGARVLTRESEDEGFDCCQGDDKKVELLSLAGWRLLYAIVRWL